jgi:predicted permease
MDDWRARLRDVIAGWSLSPEDLAAVTDELESHLEQQLQELTPRIGAVAALEQVLAEVGDPALRTARISPRHRPPPNVDAARQAGRGWEAVWRDLRHGWRSLRRTPGTTTMAIVALALGIGLTTVMFSIIYGTLVRGLPYDDADRIVMIERSIPEGGRDEILSMHEFLGMREAQRSFESFGGYVGSTVNLSGDDQPERASAARVTAGAMAVPRVPPLLGRLVQPHDEQPTSPLVAVLSFGLWRERYASDSGVVGKPVRINGLPATIVGVMPEGFDFPIASRLWIPLRLDTTLPWTAGPQVIGVARLRAGVTVAEANADLASIGARLDAEHPRPNHMTMARTIPFVRAVIRSQVFVLLYAMLVAVGLVLLIACVNVANLLLARAAARAKEMVVRRALGASAVALARQTLIESLLIAFIAAAAGAVLAQLGLQLFNYVTVGQFPFFSDIRLHPQVFAFIAATALAASLASGTLPALAVTRSDPGDVLKERSFGSSSLGIGKVSRRLVVVELALSSVLLIVTALTTKSLVNLRSVDPGFRTAQVLTAQVTLTSRDSTRNAGFMARLEDDLTHMPGVTAATLTTGLPGTGWGQVAAVVEGEVVGAARRPVARHLAVSAGFFDVLGVRMIRGRPITEDDQPGTLPVAVVNQRFVDERLDGADPIGRRIDVGESDSTPRWVTIVGVMPRLYAQSAQDPWPAELVTAFAQTPRNSATIMLHASGPAGISARPLRALVSSIDPALPVYSIATMDAVMTEALWPYRVFGGLFAIFGIIALALASIGLYAVVSFAVRQREREMGIRMALGAANADLMRLVFRHGAGQLAVGVPIGLILGIGAARLARSLFFGVQPADPVALAVVVGTITATGFVACVGPAFRAARADPIRSLRSD